MTPDVFSLETLITRALTEETFRKDLLRAPEKTLRNMGVKPGKQLDEVVNLIKFGSYGSLQRLANVFHPDIAIDCELEKLERDIQF